MTEEDFRGALSQINALYAKTKNYIIRAEEIDQTLRSNIAVFKEQRDGLDHIMRAVHEYLDKASAADTNYVLQQFGDAEGHLYRAAYDALDGMGISYKIRINQIIDRFSFRAIQAGCPNYADILQSITDLDERIVEHRKNKDQRRTTLVELDQYFETIKNLDAHARGILHKVPFIQKARREQRWESILYLALVPLAIALMALGADWYWHLRDSKLHPEATPALHSSASPDFAPPRSPP